MSSRDLEPCSRERGVRFRILEYGGSTATVQEAERRLGIDKSSIVKSILFVDDRGEPVLAIVTGDKMVDEEKLARACGAER